MAGAIESNAKMNYVAMFNAIDEGTVILKCAQEVPVGKSIFVPCAKEIPTNIYLWLTGMAGKMLRGDIPFSKNMPEREN
jgi:glycoprotein endo-alpha-1,2-mannosidase